MQILSSFRDKFNFTFKIQSYIIFNLDTSLIKEKNTKYQSQSNINVTLATLLTWTPTLRIGSNVAARCCLFDTLLSSNLSSSLVTLSTRLRSACFYNQETQNRCVHCVELSSHHT